MRRALFEKTGNAVWISHLDLMRLFQRAFKRAGLRLTHTQGFNPRPSVSIALPLSVGVESYCELLDFELEGDIPSDGEICDRLNSALIDGIRVRCVYPSGRKIRDLSLLSCRVELEYGEEVKETLAADIQALFQRASLTVEKRGKNGPTQQDLIPMIRRLSVSVSSEKTLAVSALVCCQNPTLNPAQLVAAIGAYMPEAAPQYSKITRLEIFDSGEKIFR